MSLGYDNLVNYYQINFAMANSGAFRVEEIENMIPWERQIYISILVNHVEEENIRLESSTRGARSGKGM